jgi:hypothetical protein
MGSPLEQVMSGLISGPHGGSGQVVLVTVLVLLVATRAVTVTAPDGPLHTLATSASAMIASLGLAFALLLVARLLGASQ